MPIDLLYFGALRDAMGRDGETVTPPATISTVATLIDWLAQRSTIDAEALADRSRLRAAIDQRFALPDSLIGGAAEIALFPPVTGG